MAKKKHNITWQRNQALIAETYIKLGSDLGRCPTIREIALKLKVSKTTIEKHIKELEFEPMTSPLRALTPDVLLNIYKLTKTQSASQKLWLQVMEGWKEVKELDLGFKKSIADLVSEEED